MSKSKSSWHGGKGDDSRISSFKKYQDSPLWENLKKKKYESYTEFSNDFIPLIEELEESGEVKKPD